MIRYWGTLARVELARGQIQVVRQSLLGLAVGLVIGGGMAVRPSWTALVLILYVALIQSVALFPNIRFLSFRDWRIFGFRVVSLRYRVAYVIDYVLRDTWLADIVAIGVGCVCGVVTGHASWVFLAQCLLVATLWLLPSHAHLGYRMSPHARTAYVVFILTTACGLGAGAVRWAGRVHDLSVILGLSILGLVGLYAAVIDALSLRLEDRGRVSVERQLFAWVRRFAPLLFKDLLLCWARALGVLLIGALIVALWSHGYAAYSSPFLGVFVFGAMNPFMSSRRESSGVGREYYLLELDRLFHEKALPRDRTTLRRAKLRSLGVGALFAALAYVVTSAAIHSLSRWSLVGGLWCLAVAFVIDVPCLYLVGALFRRLRLVVKYSLFVVFALGWFVQGGRIAFVAYSVVISMLYASSVVRVFGRVEGSGGIVAGVNEGGDGVGVEHA